MVAQVVLSGETHGTYLSINIAWGLAVTMGIYVAGGVSGAHLNPAVTAGPGGAPRLRLEQGGPYVAAQVAGAFAGAAVTFLTYREAFDRFDGGRAAGGGREGHRGHLRHLPAALPEHRGRARGPGGGHGDAAARDLRPGRREEPGPRAPQRALWWWARWSSSSA